MTEETSPPVAPSELSGPEILVQLQDYRTRVLEADKLVRLGREDEAKKLLPSREEIADAIILWRKSIASSSRGTTKAASSATKQKAAKISSMDDLSALF